LQEERCEVAAKRASEKAKSPKVFGQVRRPAKMFRAGIYARVSTNDQQTIPLQIRALREYAVRRGWTIALQVKEVGSGASQRQLREKLLDAARRREIDECSCGGWIVVRAGLAHARQNGQKLGRPITAGLHADRVRKLHRAGVSKGEIARQLQLGRTSVRRILTSKRA